jgi:parvulin-like peptidyl-prolyl isomerase
MRHRAWQKRRALWRAGCRRLLILIGLAALSGVASGNQAGPDRSADEQIVARCGERPISRGEVTAVMQRLGMASMPPGEQRQRAEAAVLEQLIDERVLLSILDQAGIKATRDEVEEGVSRLRDQVVGREGDFDIFLARTGRTVEDVRGQVALEIRLDKFVKPRITSDLVADAFEKNRRQLDGTKLRVSQIILRSDSSRADGGVEGLLGQAAGLRRQIIQGRISFAEAARQHSAGPSRRRGGDLGWITRDGPMLDTFSSQAYDLAKGGVSQPFVTRFGVHLVTVTDVEPGRIGVDAVRTRLQKMLAAQLVRGLVMQGRLRMPVTVAAGVPHFEPESLGKPPAERPVVVRAPETPEAG